MGGRLRALLPQQGSRGMAHRLAGWATHTPMLRWKTMSMKSNLSTPTVLLVATSAIDCSKMTESLQRSGLSTRFSRVLTPRRQGSAHEAWCAARAGGCVRKSAGLGTLLKAVVNLERRSFELAVDAVRRRTILAVSWLVRPTLDPTPSLMSVRG